MKYVISDQGEVKVGGGFHSDLARDFKGKVVRAGHCGTENGKLENGEFSVWGMSIGFNIVSQAEDADILTEHFKVCKTCGGTGEVSLQERVYAGEPHMADIGTGPCPDCQQTDGDKEDFIHE